MSIHRRVLLGGFVGTLVVPSGAQVLPRPRPHVQVTDHSLKIGDTKLTLREYVSGPGPTMVRVHRDESTAGSVGQIAASELGGRFIDLVHTGGREVVFTLRGKRCTVDPNRIFTKEGIEKTLRADAAVVQEARAAVSDFATQVLKRCGEGQPLIALHNNRASTGGYGIAWYEPKGRSYFGEGNTLAHRGAGHVQNFSIVTTRALFDSFVAMGESVVYQNPATDENDGSMSYYFGLHSRAYINIEAAHDDATSQWATLKHAFRGQEVLTQASQ